MKCLVSIAVFVGWSALLSAQVEVAGRGVTSPFIAYDDASLAEPGTLSIGQYASLDNSAGGKSFSVPGLDFSLGLNRRLELSAFGAVVFSHDDVGQFASKIDDSSAGLKVLLWNEADCRPGVAAKPMIERLASPNGAGRVHLVLPVILEKEIQFCDLAYTAGYVTRGIAFSSLKCGWAGDHRVTPLAVIAGSRATEHLGQLHSLGLNRTQLHGSAGVSVNISPSWSLFLEVGRTLGRKDQNSSSFEFTASIAFAAALWGQRSTARREHARVPNR